MVPTGGVGAAAVVACERRADARDSFLVEYLAPGGISRTSDPCSAAFAAGGRAAGRPGAADAVAIMTPDSAKENATTTEARPRRRRLPSPG